MPGDPCDPPVLGDDSSNIYRNEAVTQNCVIYHCTVTVCTVTVCTKTVSIPAYITCSHEKTLVGSVGSAIGPQYGTYEQREAFAFRFEEGATLYRRHPARAFQASTEPLL